MSFWSAVRICGVPTRYAGAAVQKRAPDPQALPPQLRLLRYYDEDDEIEAAAVFNHPGEVISLSTTAAHPDLVASIGGEGGKATGAVWRMPAVPASDGQAGYRSSAPVLDLERLCTLPRGASNPQHVAWRPAPLGDGSEGAAAAPDQSADQLLSLDDSAAHVWQLRPGSGAASAPASVATLQVRLETLEGARHGLPPSPPRTPSMSAAAPPAAREHGLHWRLRLGPAPCLRGGDRRGLIHPVLGPADWGAAEGHPARSPRRQLRSRADVQSQQAVAPRLWR